MFKAFEVIKSLVRIYKNVISGNT